MDEQQQPKAEEITRNFSEALIAFYRMSSRADLLYLQADPELTRRFCNDVIGYLDARAADALASQDQFEHTGGYQVPAELPDQVSVSALMGFLNDMLAYYKSSSITAYYSGSEEAGEGRRKTSSP